MNQPANTSHPVVFVGIDWADKKHDVHWIHANGKSGRRVIEQSPEAIEELVAQLTQIAAGGPVFLALEKSRGPLQLSLMFRDGITLYPIDPKQFASYRDSFASSGAKSDPDDAFLLARLLRERYRELKPLKPDDEPTRRIAQLGQARRQLVDESTRLRLQLQALLKTYFPLLLTFGDAASPLVLEVLRRWPDPRQFRRAHPGALKKLFQKYGPKSDEQLQERLRAVRQTPLLTRDAPVIESLVFRATALAGQLKPVLQQIAAIEQALGKAMKAHPDAALFQDCPGAGKAMAPRLLAAFGSDRERFTHADEVAVISGIAPVTRQSGKTKTVRRRRGCSKFLKQTFHEFADHARKWSRWSKAYYAWLKSKGMGHHAAVRKLASRWIRILYRIWKTRTPYDEARYLQRLQQKHHPLLKFLEN
jgi:transposase